MQHQDEQFGDTVGFANGTVSGKRVRIVGAGNIASRYASFVKMLGADVATQAAQGIPIFGGPPCWPNNSTNMTRTGDRGARSGWNTTS